MGFLGSGANDFVVVIASIAVALAVQLVLKILKPKEKVDTKAFDNILEDQGWAEEDEKDETPSEVPAVTTQSNGETSSAAEVPIPEPSTTLPTPATQQKPFQKRTDDGPFEIGDRVILKGLVSAKELNGRHGMIANVWNKKTERYPIDLDLVDPKKQNAVSVKVCNIEREPEIPVEVEAKRAALVNGCLDEPNGRLFSFVFNSLRGSVSAILKGEKDPLKLSAFGWTYWTQPGGKGIYPSLKQFLSNGILEKNKLEEIEKQLNPENPEGSLEKVKEALESPLAVASWNVRIQGEFWVVAMGQLGTLVVPVSHPKQVYCVLGTKAPLGAQVMGKTPRPPKFYLTLVPWYGRLVHDPFIIATKGPNQVEIASEQVAKELIANVKLAQAEGRVVTRLAQLEVPGGSKEGLPYQVPAFMKGGGAAQPKPDFSKMEPATEEERCLVENVADFPLFPPGANGKPTPMGAWNFIRQGETEADNPNHIVVIVAANGSKLNEFKTESLSPTPVEIMKAMLGIVSKLKMRPFIMGIDDPLCCARLQFLLQGIKIRVVQVNVTRKKGPPPGAQGVEKKSE